MARRKVGVSSLQVAVFQSAAEAALSKTSPRRSKGPADPVRSGLPETIDACYSRLFSSPIARSSPMQLIIRNPFSAVPYRAVYGLRRS
ncbi:hypothetical protein J7T55_010752 [Diaporthe amygdali]|uniref:uncharacterized protein n=1 Tax=Phomopsis amygdali TaxID=1214568 RepID=UPI0022FE0244|nr:uncharacterized protein J7T55_010752 [Diaporthe amygdali]KAJ0114363.1 hypothetical protein J7T55_010752 [Diaporthe amygdali]